MNLLTMRIEQEFTQITGNTALFFAKFNKLESTTLRRMYCRFCFVFTFSFLSINSVSIFRVIFLPLFTISREKLPKLPTWTIRKLINPSAQLTAHRSICTRYLKQLKKPCSLSTCEFLRSLLLTGNKNNENDKCILLTYDIFFLDPLYQDNLDHNSFCKQGIIQWVKCQA